MGEMFAPGTVAVGFNDAGKGYGYMGELATAPRVIKDVVAAARMLSPKLPKAS